MKHTTRPIPLLLFSLLATGPVRATVQDPGAHPGEQTQGKEEEQKQQPDKEVEVVVVATRQERRTKDIPVPVVVVDREDLRANAPQTLGDALRGKPGVWSTQSSGGRGETPIVRGLTGNQVLTLINGIRLNNTLLPPPGPFTLHATIFLEDVERIEVLKTPGSVLYGTGAVGGVVNIIPAQPPAYDPAGLLGAELTLRGSSADTGFRSHLAVDGATAGTRFRVGVGADSAGDLRTGAGQILNPTGQQTRSLDAALYFATGEDSELRLRSQFVRLDSDRDYLAPTRPSYSVTDRSLISAEWESGRDMGWADHFKVQLWTTRWDSDFERLDRVEIRTRNVSSYGVDLQAGLESGMHRWTYGLQAYTDFSEDASTTSSGTVKSVPDGKHLDAAVYVQDELELSQSLHVLAGLRGNYYRTTTDPDSATIPAGFTTQDMTISEAHGAFTGSLGIVADITDRVSLTGSAARGYRVPGVSELAGIIVHPDGVAVGSPDLSPEESWTLDVGARYQDDRLDASLSAFRTWLQNLIIGEPGLFQGQPFFDRNGNGTPDPNEWVTVRSNSGRAVLTGIEAQASYWLGNGFSTGGGFSWVIGTDEEKDKPLNFVPPAFGTVFLRYTEPMEERWWAQLDFQAARHQGRIPDDA